MKQQINGVVGGRAQSKKLDIESVGKPRQRVPVRLFKRGERPADSAPVKARTYIWILDYIAVIVVAQESRMHGAAVDRQSTRRQQQAKNDSALAARSESIRHMIIESGFEPEASWIVGTKKKSPAVCWALAFVQESTWFRCQVWQ